MSSATIDDEIMLDATKISTNGEIAMIEMTSPDLLHRVQHNSSILAIAVSDKYIYAGTQDGEVLAWSLDSYELAIRIKAHKRAVLCLFLSQDGKLLFSSAG